MSAGQKKPLASTIPLRTVRLALANNSLNNLTKDFLDLNLFEVVPDDSKRRPQEALNKITTIQGVTFGIHELTASRYELLCGRQGASEVADTELLSASIDAPPHTTMLVDRHIISNSAKRSRTPPRGRGAKLQPEAVRVPDEADAAKRNLQADLEAVDNLSRGLAPPIRNGRRSEHVIGS